MNTQSNENVATPVVMGRGNVAVGTCKRAEDGIPGIIYLDIPEARDHGTDCADVYPVGSPAPRDKVLACIQFETAQVLQQSIDVLKELQQLHYPVAESAPPNLLNLMPEVIATLRAEGMSVDLVNKLELAMAEPAVSHPSEREALTELVDLHDIKLRMAKLAAEPDYLDSLDKMVTYDLLSSDYSNRRPKAWQAASAALSAPSMDETVEAILTSVCETDPADPNKSDTICIEVSDLSGILKAHLISGAISLSRSK